MTSNIYTRRMLRSTVILFGAAALLSIFGFWYDDVVGVDREVLARGKSIYHNACSPCHGAKGKGDGILAANIIEKPRNLTSGVYENRSTMTGQLPTKDDLFRTITDGIHNTPMPTFRRLDSEDRWAVTEYIMTLSQRFSDPDEYPLDILPESEAPPFGPHALAQGRKIYVAMKCADCHGATGKGEGEIVKKQFDEHGEAIETPDLTDPRSYEFSRSVRDVYRILSTGLDGTPMPSYLATINDADRWYLSYYTWSLRDGYWYTQSVGDSSGSDKR